MTQMNQQSPAGGKSGPLNLRTLAILLMVAGAISFVAARILFGDQVLCLLGSTVIVFGGLGLIVYARRNNLETRSGESAPPVQPERWSPAGSTPGRMPRSTPRGLRTAARQPGTPGTQTSVTPPAQPVQNISPVEPAHPMQTTPTTASFVERVGARPGRSGETLVNQAITAFERQGARVDIETRRADRGILYVHTQDDLAYTVMVDEESGPVDVADVRALHALVTSNQHAGGYLIAAGPFTQKAYDLASARQIRLVTADELEELD